MPRVVTGAPHSANKGAIDWGWHGLVAYGSQSLVVVLYVDSVRELQTLQGHRNPVNCVRWPKEDYPHDYADNAYHLSLASSDSSGLIIIWDINAAVQKCSFYEGKLSVLDMHWALTEDSARCFLAVLHSPDLFVVWNAHTGTQQWKYRYNDIPLMMFNFNPFDRSSVAFLTQNGSILLTDDFSTSKPPSSAGQQFCMSNLHSGSSNAAPGISSSQSGGGSYTTTTGSEPAVNDGKSQRSQSLAHRMMRQPLNMVFGSGQAARDYTSTSQQQGDDQCIQATFHPSIRNRLILVYPKEALFLDLKTSQTVAHVVLERSYAPLHRVLPCSQADAVYFVQENGCVTLRVLKFRKSATEPIQVDVFNPSELYYESLCSSDSLRITKAYRVFGAAVNPVTEKQSVLWMSNGRILLLDLMTSAPSPGHAEQPCLRDCIGEDRCTNLTPKSKYRFFLSGLHQGISGTPTVVSCSRAHMVQDKANDDPGSSFLTAVGTSEGCVQLVDVRTGVITMDLTVHNCAVHCLEWGDASQIISAGYTQTLSTATVVRNELFVTDIETGLSKAVRPESDETPITMIRVSFYFSYVAIAFRDQPLEIWDIKTFKLLRRMSRACPIIVDMAWSGKHHNAKQVDNVPSDENTQNDSQVDATIPNDSKNGNGLVYRENLVVLDNDNHLFHVVVKGMHVRDGKEVNTQWATNSIVTCMRWKDDFLAFGDSDGRISLWDLSKRQSKASPSQRSAVKRMQFSHLPGDFTLAVLHGDGLSVWDMSKFQCLHQLFTTRDFLWRIVDMDLIPGENSAVLVSDDGCMRIFDRSLTQQCSPVKDSVLHEVFCPSLLPPAVSWLLKLVLLDPFAQKDLNCTDLKSYLKKNAVISDDEVRLLSNHLNALDNAFTPLLRDPSAEAWQRALFVARLFGDEWDVKFWTVASDFFDTDKSNVLPSSMDIFADKDLFQRRALVSCSLFDAKRATWDQLSPQIEKLVLLKQTEQAVQILLDSDNQQADYETNCLKACLLSAVNDSSPCQSTIKLVATNLIASGKLSDGVQLLCMIGKQLDACRYLQSYKQWYRAAWLAKVCLSGNDYVEVMKKWADDLCTPASSQNTLAILLLLSLGQFERVLEALLTLRYFTCAAVLLQACEAHDEKIDKNGQNLPKTNVASMSSSLKEAIFAEYARELLKLGLPTVGLHFAKRAGQRGESVHKEIEVVLASQ